MYKFGKRSQKNLSECHEDLQLLFLTVIQHRDCSIIEGERGSKEQNYMYQMGHSELKFPSSKHNCSPSKAADVWPYPRPHWSNTAAWKEFATFVVGVAAGLGLKIKSGGISWGWDYPHFEIID